MFIHKFMGYRLPPLFAAIFISWLISTALLSGGGINF